MSCVFPRKFHFTTPTTRFPTLDTSRSMFELVLQAVVCYSPMLGNVDFVGDEDLGKFGFEDGPEDGHGGADDGEVNFETG